VASLVTVAEFGTLLAHILPIRTEGRFQEIGIKLFGFKD
jgi:hypothetical protein